MSDEPFSLKKLFGTVAKGVGLIAITEVIIFTLVHANTGGMSLMAAITPTINSIFNATGITKGMYGLAKLFGGGPTEMAKSVGGEIVQDAGLGEMMLPALGG